MQPSTKQVIVIRRELGMRRGKEISQGSHAALSFLTKRVLPNGTLDPANPITPVQHAWLSSSFRKVCLQVQTEEELLQIEAKAKEANVECHVVTDSGLTEFHGVPTRTCLALGPDTDENIDAITRHLKLY